MPASPTSSTACGPAPSRTESTAASSARRPNNEPGIPALPPALSIAASATSGSPPGATAGTYKKLNQPDSEIVRSLTGSWTLRLDRLQAIETRGDHDHGALLRGVGRAQGRQYVGRVGADGRRIGGERGADVEDERLRADGLGQRRQRGC